MRYLPILISVLVVSITPVVAQADTAKPASVQGEAAPAKAFVPPKFGKPENRVGGATRQYSGAPNEEEGKNQKPPANPPEEPKKEAR